MATSPAVYQDGQVTKTSRISLDTGARTQGGQSWAEYTDGPQNVVSGGVVDVVWQETGDGGGLIAGTAFTVPEDGWYEVVVSVRLTIFPADLPGTVRCTAHLDGGADAFGDSGPQVSVSDKNWCEALVSRYMVAGTTVSFKAHQTNTAGAARYMSNGQITATKLL